MTRKTKAGFIASAPPVPAPDSRHPRIRRPVSSFSRSSRVASAAIAVSNLGGILGLSVAGWLTSNPLRTIRLQRLLAGDPIQRTAVGIVALHGVAGVDALAALGAGKHQALDVAWLESHRADVVAERRTIGAGVGALPRVAHHHRPAIGHPGQTLKHPDRAAVTAEQVPGQGEFDEQHPGGDADEQRLIAGRGQLNKLP
jgi:hypothetical protein